MDKILVQWPGLAQSYPNTTYVGRFLWTTVFLFNCVTKDQYKNLLFHCLLISCVMRGQGCVSGAVKVILWSNEAVSRCFFYLPSSLDVGLSDIGSFMLNHFIEGPGSVCVLWESETLVTRLSHELSPASSSTVSKSFRQPSAILFPILTFHCYIVAVLQLQWVNQEPVCDSVLCSLQGKTSAATHQKNWHKTVVLC